VTERRDGRLAIAAESGPKLLTSLAAFLADADATLVSLESGSGTLEDVYLRLVATRVQP